MPFPVLETAFNETNAQFSPDGRWIAYQSDESGRVEIYVQPFRGRDARCEYLAAAAFRCAGEVTARSYFIWRLTIG